jgi:hypothetical protein
MAGGTKSTAELVKETKRGILVTRTWYIRMVDPQTVLLTGLTRDGTFYVEDGEIRYPVKNFRFNESPVIMLNNLEELGRSERLASGFGGGLVLKVPSLKVRDFTFTSLSDAVCDWRLLCEPLTLLGEGLERRLRMDRRSGLAVTRGSHLVGRPRIRTPLPAGEG